MRIDGKIMKAIIIVRRNTILYPYSLQIKVTAMLRGNQFYIIAKAVCVALVAGEKLAVVIFLT